MKYNKLILIGALIVASIVPTQAAVYGTLKQDMYFNVNDKDEIKKTSGSGISIIGEDGESYLVRVDETNSELVNKSLITLTGVITKTKVSEAVVLDEAEKDANVLETLDCGELVMALEKTGDYYKVKVNDTVGYIHEAEIENGKLTSLQDTKEEKSKGEEIVEYAKTYLGGRYVYGGNNLKTGVDCSGFTQQIMKQFNISLGRSSRDQYASNGYKVSTSDILPGDLVFYGYGGYINHVAIYAGGNQIIHASTERTGITMGSLYGSTPIIGVKRVV